MTCHPPASPEGDGVISFRATPERLAVVDDTAAMEEARRVYPDAIKRAESLDKGLYAAYALDALRTTGEILPGVELIAASESVKIVTGAKE